MAMRFNDNAPRLKMFVPCMQNRCAALGNKMQLIDYDDHTTYPKYKCEQVGCIFHDAPYDAREIVWWHRSPEGVRDGSGERDAPTAKDWETAI